MTISVSLKDSLMDDDFPMDGLIQIRKDGRTLFYTVEQLFAIFEQRMEESNGKNKSVS